MMISNINDLKVFLDQTFSAEKSASQHQTLQNTIALLSQKNQIITIMESLLYSNEELELIAKRSYNHSNGFDKIVLLSSQFLYKLRLHIWWPNENRKFIEDIHNHRWNFGSAVLCGSLTSQEYQVSDRGTEMYSYKYSSPEGRGYYAMEFTGKSTVMKTNYNIMTSGYCYTLAHDVLHRVTSNRKNCTATLVLQGPVIKNMTNVFSEQQVNNAEKIDVPILTVSELFNRLECFLEIIKNN